MKKFDPESRGSLSAVFNGAGERCELPTGEVVEVLGRKTPFYALCRELDRLGYGDHRIEISTPAGTPSMRAVVSVAAGLAISERDDRGLRMEKFRPFPGTRSAPGTRSGSFSTHTPQSAPTHCTDSLVAVATRPMSPSGKCQTVDMKMKPADLRNLTELNPADPKNLTRPEGTERLGDRGLQPIQSDCQCYSGESQTDGNLGRYGTALVLPESLQDASVDGHAFCLPCGVFGRLLLFFSTDQAVEVILRLFRSIFNGLWVLKL